jgi:hypothetical protein
MRRRKLGEEAALPLEKRYLFPVTWRKGEFTLRPCTGQESARVELATGRRAENLVLALSHDHPYDPGLVRSVRLSAKPASSSWTSQPGWRWSRQRPPPASPPAWTPGSSTHWPWPVGAGLCASRAGRLGPRSSCTSRTPKPAGPRARPGAPRFRQGPGPPAERARVRGASCTPARGGRVQVQEGRQAGLQPGGAPCCRLPEQAKVSSAVIGDPSGVRDRDAGAVQNRRTHRWLVVHTTRALCYRLEEVGIAAELTEVSGTSSHCPDCGAVAGSWSAPTPLVAPCTTATSRARRTWSGNWAVHRV